VKKAVNALKKIGLFDFAVGLLIILFISLVVLQERVTNERSFLIFLSSIGFCSLILIVLKYRKISFPMEASSFIFLFFGWMIIAGFFSKDISETIWEILKTASYFALFFAIYNLVRKKKSIQFFLLSSFTIIGTFLVARDMYYFFSWGELQKGTYLVGSFYWHNQMAGFLVILIPLLWNLFLVTRNFYFKPFLFFLLLVLIVGIVLTQSRGAWLSLSAGLMVFALIYFRRMKLAIKPIFVLVMLFILIVTIFQPLGIVDKLRSIKEELFSETRTVSGNLRVTVWRGTFYMISDNPVFGVGPGAFGSAYQKYQEAPWLYAKNTHNQYLEYAAETGIVGFLLFIAIILSAILIVFRTRKEIADNVRYPLLAGAAAALFGSGAHAIIDTDWSRISLYSIFWILMAIVLASLSKKEKVFEVVGIKKTLYLFLFFPLVVALMLGISDRSYEMAKKSLEEGKVQEAEGSILKAIKFNPYDFSSQFLYGQIKEIQKRPEGAKNLYRKASWLSVFNSEPLYRIGLIEFQKENYKEAKKWFEEAVGLNPYSHPRLYNAVSDTYLKLKDKEKARDNLKLAVEGAFPLNSSFKGFEYLYDYTGFKKDLGETYVKLILLDIALGEKEEAGRLLVTLEKDLDSENPLIPVLYEAMLK